MKKNPYVLVDKRTNIVIKSVGGNMPQAFNKAVAQATEYAKKRGHLIAVVADPYGYKKGVEVTPVFWAMGPYIVVDAYGQIFNYGKNPPNIARKADVPWQDPFVQARLSFPGTHSAWDEPEDHPPYPMAGELQKEMIRKQSWDRLQKERRRMYGRKAMNPAPYFGDYDYEEEPEIYCPACGGEPQHMGTLGKYDWFKCRRCGWQFKMATNPAEVAGDVVAIYASRGGKYQLWVMRDAYGCYMIKDITVMSSLHQMETQLHVPGAGPRGIVRGEMHGLCDERALNDKIMETIYYADKIDGIHYELVYP